jgi:hypothetical protein
MKINIKSGSPDGVIVNIELYIMTWEELKNLIDVIADIESGSLSKKVK